MPPLRRICVFCGSRPGKRPEYLERATELGVALAHRRIDLVYGGSNIGLMGAVADAVLARGGKVTGVIPRRLQDREIAHQELTELRVVETMHQRKALMEELSDGFIALPGGFGTLEEILEITTWMQLGIHHKPIGLLDVEGYYHPLLELIRHGVEEGFIPPEQAAAIHHDPDPGALLEKLLAAPPVRVEQTLSREET